MWNRSRPTRASFWSAWKSRTWMRSTASRRRSPSGRRTRRAIRARRSPPPPNATIFCACCSRAWAGRSARTAARACARTRWTRWRRGCWRSRRGRAGTRCFRAASTPPRDALRDHLFDLRKKGFNRLFQDGRMFEFSTPESLLDIDFTQAGVRAGGSPGDRAGSAPAAGRHRRDLLPRGRRSDLRERARTASGCASTRSFSARPAAWSSRSRSRVCSASTARSAPARAARASATPSISTWTCVIPDRSLSLDEGAVDPWTKPKYRSWLGEFQKARARARCA